jgi:transcriptional regulator
MRSNPLYAALSADGRATILFKGPDAYVSPEYAGLLDWGPTWNYAQIKVSADVTFDADFTETSLDVLVQAMETGRERPWHVGQLGERYIGMLQYIIGFRAVVTGLSGKFKLGQDEKPAIYASIIHSLPDAGTVEWMRRFNKGRK